VKITLSDTQWNVFKTLSESDRLLSIEDITSASGIDHAMVMATIMYGQEQGWLTVEEIVKDELILSEDFISHEPHHVPERRALLFLKEKGRVTMQELAQFAKSYGIALNEVIKWGLRRGWFKKDNKEMSITEAGLSALNSLDSDEKAIKIALKKGSIFFNELPSDIDSKTVKEFLKNRHSVGKIKERKIRLVQLTNKGQSVLTDDIKIVKEQNILTSEDITSGNWENIRLRPYDVTVEAHHIYPAKVHPLQRIIQQTRKAFLEMGFTEVVSPEVDSCFWVFDALFQPQDHPARDMQDTFYIERPGKARLPEAEVVQRVRLTHENGWETGSKGWGYTWRPEEAQRIVLRTHTTATTVRALAENPHPSQKIFCVGKVFRNESISYKHLPEFFQVDGIIIDEHASLATLLGTLKEFYKKMGFDKVKFKPSFFPYTEPSAEVFVFMKSKNKWIELGGSGIFRPEVTQPFGCTVPVLAWGLGLERLAMMRYQLNDIRELYFSDFDTIKEISLCQ
jgi:phenylalanyl-tRNA synthetase alpha chain